MENGLEVLVIQNQNLIHSKLIIQLDVGSIYDPSEVPGLSHLIEHIRAHRSSKYTKRNELLAFHSVPRSHLAISTSKERMTFSLTINDTKLCKSADMVAWPLHEPLFNENDIKNEIGVIDQELKGYLKDELLIKSRLNEIAIDKSFPEHSFICGNKKTLSVSNIAEILKEHHKKHFNPDRMKLVIYSRSSIEDLKKIAEIFNLLTRRQSKEHSKTTHPVHVKYSEKFASKIVKYTQDLEKNILSAMISIPSNLHSFKYRRLEYTMEVIKNFYKKFKDNKLAHLITDMDIMYEKNQRTTNFHIDFELTQEGELKVNEILGIFANYINSHVPSTEIFDYIKGNLFIVSNKLSPEGKCSSQALSFLQCPHENFKNYTTECEFNEGAFKETLGLIGNAHNWFVIQSTNEKNLPNKEEYFMIQYGDPEPINIDLIVADDVDKKSSSDRNSTNNFNEIVENELKVAKSRSVIRKQLEHGEYTVFFDRKYNDECDIKLTFISKLESDQVVSNLVYWATLFKHLKSKHAILKDKLFSNYLKFPPQIIFLINCKRKDALVIIKLIFETIKAFKPTEEEISKSKKDLNDNLLTKLRKNETYPSLFPALLTFINSRPVADEYLSQIEDAKCTPCPSYYINIHSIGYITETETKAIYEIVKSSSSLRHLDQICVTPKTFKHNTLDEVKRGFLAAYNIESDDFIGDVSTSRKFAISLVFKAILTTDFFTFLQIRVPNSI